MNRTAIYPAEPAKGWRPWGALVPFLGVAFVAVTVIPLQIVLQKLQLLDAHENPTGLLGFVVFLLLPFSALGLAVLAWVRFVERRPLAAIGLPGGQWLRRFLLGQLTGVAMTSAIVAGTWLAGASSVSDIMPALSQPAALAGIAILLACFSVQSSVEEIVFRGWMLSAVADKFGTLAGVALSSLVFALLHFDPHATWVFGVNVVLFAVFACSWSIRTGNVWGLMGWHAGWNWLLATGFELRVTGLDAHLPALLVKTIPHGPDYLTGGSEGPEGSILCGLLLLGGIAFNVLRAKRI
ncbi:MAG TPA: type II CAAX endopeptidase family protein [Rhizomicrobium sp.]|jgi:membrane protease YdiL (CAAX protease family)|nr:type II CAAX endopeptidase family protein [Rhizomicrobium sp.]